MFIRKKKEFFFKFKILGFLALTIISGAVVYPGLAGASLPSTLYFDENKFITIENCQFSNSNLSSLSGKGDLTLNLSKFKKSIGKLSFEGLSAEPSGKIVGIKSPYSLSINRYTIKSVKPILGPSGAKLMSIPEGTIEILIPELNATLSLSFVNLALNDWGEIEAESLALSAEPPTLPNLAGLAGFDLDIIKLTGKIQEGIPYLSISASVDFSGQKIPVELSYPGLVVNLAKWNYPFRGKEISVSDSTLDLSPSGGIINQEVDASWVGIYIARGSFKANGTSFEVRDCYIDAQGFTGKIAGTSGHEKFVGNISYEKLSLEIDIKHNEDIKNFIRIEKCSFPPLESSLTLSGTLDENGYSLSVETLDNPKVGYEPLVLSAQIARGQFFQTEGKYVLWLDGVITFNHSKLPKGAVEFRNLGIDSEGNFVFPQTGLEVESPAPLDFANLFKCNVSSLKILSDTSKRLKIMLDGELSLGADIPLNGNISFQELSLKEGPEVTLAGVKADFSLKGVARIAGKLEKKEDSLAGEASFYLFGSSAPLGAGFGFKIYSYRSWAVAGEVSLSPPINIPNTYLFIYSFSGGVGRNVKKAENQPFTIDNLQRSESPESWLFMAGTKIATVPMELLVCYPLQLTVGFPQLSFSLYGQCTIINGPKITSSIEFNPLKPFFKLTSQANLNLYNVVTVQGGMEVFAGKKEGKNVVSVAIGWPYPDNAVGFSMLNGKIYGRYGLYGYTAGSGIQISARAGAGLNVYVFKGSIEGSFNFYTTSDPFLSGEAAAEGEIDVWVGAIGASGELAVDVYKEPKLHYEGEVSGWVKIFGKKLEISKDISGEITL